MTHIFCRKKDRDMNNEWREKAARRAAYLRQANRELREQDRKKAEEMVTFKGKPVTLFELFYDLTFVYAVSHMTGVLEHPENGVVPAHAVWIHLLTAFIVLQAWLYQTNYNNRFASGRWYENAVMALNMMAALFMSNIIGVDSELTYQPFCNVMIILLGDIALLYAIKAKENSAGTAFARRFSKMLFTYAGIYAVNSLLFVLPIPDTLPLVMLNITVFSGAFFPIFIRKDFNKEIVDFPHLTERFELLTIVTFGEMIVSAGAYFTLESFSRHSVFVFSIIIMLFGCYVIHNHYMIDRHADTRGFMLMFSHYAMVIALNVITAATNLIAENEINGQTVTNMMLGASLLYFAGMFLNSVYYKRKLWTAAEKIAAGCALIAGAIVMIAMLSPKGCLIGMLVMSAGLFVVLLYKTKKQRIVCREAE